MSTTTTKTNISTQKADRLAEYSALVTAIEKDLAAVDTFVLRKVTYTRPQLIALLQGVVEAATAVKTARGALQVTIAHERDVLKNVAPVRAGMKTYLQARFGKDAPELQTYGFTPDRTPQRPVSSKAKGVAQGQATRAARHTMGKKQKAQIRGSVSTEATTSAPSAPAPVAPPVAPAPATPAAATPPPVAESPAPTAGASSHATSSAR